MFKDKNQNDMAFIFLSTLYGNIKVLVFSSTWKDKELQETLQLGKIIMIKGRKNGDAIILNGAEELE